MSIPPKINTTDTFGQWIEAFNELTDSVANTGEYVLVTHNSTPQISTGNVHVDGTILTSRLVANANVSLGATSLTQPTGILKVTTNSVANVVTITGNKFTANTTVAEFSNTVNIGGTVTIGGTFFTDRSQNFSWVEKSINTVYYADCDGFVVVAADVKDGGANTTNIFFVGYCDENADLDLRGRSLRRLTFMLNSSTGPKYGSTMMPVKAGQWWSVFFYGANGSVATPTIDVHHNVYYVPLGLAGVSSGSGEYAEPVPTNAPANPTDPSAAVYGYMLGGYSSSSTTARTDKITFSSGVVAASTIADLSYTRADVAGLSDCATYGYAVGGFNPNVALTYVDRITLSTQAAAATSPFSLSIYGTHAVSDSKYYGYVAGGIINGSTSAAAYRMTFSTGAWASSTISNITQARKSGRGLSDAIQYGYFMGGISSSTYMSRVDRISFTTGITAILGINQLTVEREQPATVSDGNVYGYAFGGATSSSGYLSSADRIVFSTGITSASSVSNLSVARRGASGVSDGMRGSGFYGYIMGGVSYSAGNVFLNSIDQITFSNSTTAAYTVSTISLARYAGASLSDYCV